MKTTAFALLSLLPSCEESLPPRVGPVRFLQASMFVQPNSVVNVFIDSSALGFPITINGPSGSVELRLRSFFNEALEERPFFRAAIDLWLTSQPTVRTRVELTEVNVEYPYLEPGSLLTLVPGDSVSMSKQWHHSADNGRGFWNFVQLRGRIDGAGRFFYESAPVRYTATGSMQVFENVPAERIAGYEFELVYHVYVRYPPLALHERRSREPVPLQNYVRAKSLGLGSWFKDAKTEGGSNVGDP